MTAVAERPKKTQRQPEAAPLYAYGITFPEDPTLRKILASPLLTELWFFKNCASFKDLKEQYTGEGTFHHGRRAADMLFRQKGKEVFVWHDDLETAFREYCMTNEVLVTGPASDGKTFGAALYAILFWACDPQRSGVLCTSTTVPGLRKRIWGEIRKLFMHIKDYAIFANSEANFVDTQLALQASRGDMKRGIFGLAVAEGNETKALGRIIGFHPPRLLVIVDELTDVSMAIVEACTNLFTAKEKAQFIGIGNAHSIFDSHGKLCEPKEGWNSVNVSSERWVTVNNGICLHFDGFKSPNIVAGKIIYPFLLSQEDIDKTAARYGENSPQMWRMRRGFWCPEGVIHSIISESLINKFRAMSKAEWMGEKTEVASLDPAFEGGDRCVLRFGKYGKDATENNVLELGEIVIIKVNLTGKEPIHYQIARQVRDNCSSRNIPVENFAMDVSGEGGGLASIIQEEWGHNFHQVNFGGSASDLPASTSDYRPGNEVYHNRVCELWYSFRMAIMASQIRGLDPETAVEFCCRLYESKAKIHLETKAEMKLRLNGKSPDLADCSVVMLDLVRNRGGLGMPVTKARKSINREWDKFVKEFSMGEATYSNDAVLNV